MKVAKMSDKQRENAIGLTLALIPVIGFVLFGVAPLLFSFVMSFANVPSFNYIEMRGLSNFFQYY
jgi:ABC-type sugar transport system permease subunit